MNERIAADGGAGWREAAVDRALGAEAAGGDAHHALLGAIRGALPGCPTLSVEVDGAGRYLAYLGGAGGGGRSLLAAEHARLTRSGARVPEVSWHSLARGGLKAEVVVVPSGHRATTAVFVGRGSTAAEDLPRLAGDLLAFCARPSGRALVYSGNAWREDAAMDGELAGACWEGVVLPPGQAAEIRASVEGFFARREAYREMGVAWRRGVLLVGPPGTGKTMVCKAAASSLPEVPFLYVRDLSGYDTREEMIAEVFGRARELAPAVLAFEDLDGLVGDADRAVFLNEMDGFRPNDGLLVLASSNHPGRIDEALLRRPSRFDRVFRIGPPREEERREYCLRLLRRPALLGRVGGLDGAGRLADKVARATGGLTPAHIQEAVVGAALEVAHGGEDGADAGRADHTFAERVMRQVGALRAHASESREPGKLAEGRDPARPGPGFRP